MPEIIPLDMPAAYWRGKAQQARRAGSPREAVRLYRAALRKHGENAIRRELAEVYADMRCLSASDRLYLENLARDAGDADSVFGLARNRSLAGDERTMADLLDLYLRMAPCGEQADRARDILWQLPREGNTPRRLHRAQARFRQAADVQSQPRESLRRARQSWRRGRLPENARLLSQLYLQLGQYGKAMQYAGEACRMAPEDLTARQLLAAALHGAGLDHACRQAMLRAADMCRTMDQLPGYCACAVSLGQSDLAVKKTEEMLERFPDSADLMLLLAVALRDMPGQEERARQLAESAAALDEENPAIQMLLEDPGSDPLTRLLQQLRRIGERAAEAGTDGDMSDALRGEVLRAMRLPVPGLTEAALHLFMQAGDALGLRLVLLEGGLPPMLYGLAISTLQEMGEPMPCLARVEGRLMQVPPRTRPPYDPDLQELIHVLLRRLPEQVELDRVTREVPPLWRQLPISARRHCAQSRDEVWPDAFAAYLILRCGDSAAAREEIQKNACPRRTGRAFMQLIRRSKQPYEVHRF